MTCILGIDPGASGALAFYYLETRDRVAVEDMPLVDGGISSALLAQTIRKMGPRMAMIESVGARPGQGVSSMFAFGKSFGQALGVLGALEVPTHFITPAKWKKHFRLTSDKEEARYKAIQFFPACAGHFARKKDHGRAEAALIARYAAETMFPWSAAA
jgi:crossover junction endodeoxyribonuclease RuvC